MDIMQILLVITSVLGFVGIPSLLLYSLAVRRLTFTGSVALVLMAQSIAFSLTALFFGYNPVVTCLEVLVASLIMVLLIFLRYLKGKKPAPGPRLRISYAAILIFCIAAVVFISVPLITNVPFDVDGQGFGYMSLVVKQGGSITHLSPYYPDVEWVYSPAFPIFSAFISDVSGAPLHVAMPVFAAILSILLLASAYEFGRFAKDRLFGLLMVICMFIGLWLFTSYLDGHYAMILATLFLVYFLRYFFSALKRPDFYNISLSAIALAGVAYAHPDTIFNLLIAFVPFYIIIFLSRERKTLSMKRYMALFFLIPIIAVIIFSPYMLYAVKVLAANSFEHIGFYTSMRNLSFIVIYGGLLIPLLAIIGLYYAVKRRTAMDLLMVTWFFAIIEFSSIGFFEWLFSRFRYSPMSLMYPTGVGWHAPIIPYAFLASVALYSLFRAFRNKSPKLHEYLAGKLSLFLSVVLIVLVVSVFFAPKIIGFSKKFPLPLYGEFSSKDDVNAMLWLKENTPEDAFILNYPIVNLENGTRSGYFEGHWVPVISERKTVYFRIQPFFFNKQPVLDMQRELYSAYVDPASEASKQLMFEYGIDYVIVPQIMGNTTAFSSMYRWKPVKDMVEQKSRFEDADYLKLVYDSSGAKVFKVVAV